MIKVFGAVLPPFEAHDLNDLQRTASWLSSKYLRLLEILSPEGRQFKSLRTHSFQISNTAVSEKEHGF
jgi:hypothetical protein